MNVKKQKINVVRPFMAVVAVLVTGVMALTLAVASAPAYALTTTLVTVPVSGTGSASGETYNGSTISISADGNIVAFASAASNLVANDPNGTVSDVFVRNLSTGVTQLVSVPASGTLGANGWSLNPSISADGNIVAFASAASNLVANDSNGRKGDIFVRNLSTGVTKLVSVSASGTTGANGYSVYATISADGNSVAFISAASNIIANDSNGRINDVFVRNMSTGVTELVSVPASGTSGANGDSSGASLSADGNIVAFISNASNLVASDPNGRVYDVFVRNMSTGVTELVSVPASGTSGANSYSGVASISADGNIVAFSSHASNLVANDPNGSLSDIFVRNLNTGVTKLISVPAVGTSGADSDCYYPSISADGNTVAWESGASNLVANDRNGTVRDIFVRNLSTRVTKLVSIPAYGTSGANSHPYIPRLSSYWPSISADGNSVAFTSYASNLVPSDPNGALADVFVSNLTVTPLLPVLSINDVTVTEADSDQVIATFAIRLSKTPSQEVQVKYTTVDNTAVAGTDSVVGDYQSRSGIVIFPADTTTLRQTVKVPVYGGIRDEFDEYFHVQLSDSQNATIAPVGNGIVDYGIGTIVDNDPLPSISISNARVSEGNSGTVNVVFTVSLTEASAKTVTVKYKTVNGTTTAPDDYLPTSRPLPELVFLPGEVTKPITIVVNGDTIAETNERFKVNLSSPINATVVQIDGTLTDRQGIGTIIDDDSASGSTSSAGTSTASG